MKANLTHNYHHNLGNPTPSLNIHKSSANISPNPYMLILCVYEFMDVCVGTICMYSVCIGKCTF